MFYCDPPGHADPEHLFNCGQDDVVETDFVFFHDQEPVDLELHSSLFNEIIYRNLLLFLKSKKLINNSEVYWNNVHDKLDFNEWRNSTDLIQGPDNYFRTHADKFSRFYDSNPTLFRKGHIVVSEKGENVESLSDKYGWKSHYYFYHGWACLDWFRGYDRSFLIPRALDRTPSKTFISPNRIVGGQRNHRVLFLYNIFKQNLHHNYISAPRTCSVEGLDISEIANKYYNTYPDIIQVFDRAELPRLFTGEFTQKMSSCWLTNFNEAADSLVYVPTETVYFGSRLHITEKTFKAIALEMPFVLVAPAGSLEYMRSYGFKTFDSVFDESYDTETDDIRRVERVVQLLKDLDSLTARERHQIHRACLPMVEHNYNHFYCGGFANVLWKELTHMLEGIRV